jgi:hypothetical protein
MPPDAGAARLPSVRFFRLFAVFAIVDLLPRQCDDLLKIWLPGGGKAQH